MGSTYCLYHIPAHREVAGVLDRHLKGPGMALFSFVWEKISVLQDEEDALSRVMEEDVLLIPITP